MPTWKDPKINRIRLPAAFLAFFCNGMKDSAIGVMIPALEDYYNIGYFVVSIAFLAPFVGYLVAAATNDKMHAWVGRVGVLITGALCQLTFFIIGSCAPPFPLFVVGYGLAGLGSGFIEASQNTFCGTLENSNLVLNTMHGMYGVGGVVCPAAGQAMLANNVKWQFVYTMLAGVSFTSLCFSSAAFWTDRRENYAEMTKEDEHEKQSLTDGGEVKKRGSSFVAILKSGLVWLLALCVFLYVGGEVSAGGWTTTFMISVRHGDPDKMGYVSTGFWAGIAVGRFGLGLLGLLVTNLELSVVIELIIAIALSLVYWLVKNVYASAISVALVGLAIGPLFPTMMAVGIKKLPKWQHVSGLGFASALGGGGAAVVPFIAGGLSQKFGPVTIAPLIFAAFTVMLLLWLVIIKRY